MSSQVIKVFDGYPCAHRQWKDKSHCRFIHGYQRKFVCTFDGPVDEKGWVIGFGGRAIQEIKHLLKCLFDHTLLLASDDPYYETFKQGDGVFCDLVILPHGPGMEGSARYVCECINDIIERHEPATWERGVRCVCVECWENEKNCGVWKREPLSR